MKTYTSLNQEAIRRVPGTVTGVAIIQSENVKIADGTTQTLTAGSPVKLVTEAGPEIVVDGITGASDGPVYGLLVPSLRKAVYATGGVTNLDHAVVLRQGHMNLLAGGNIARGDKLTAVPAPDLTADTYVRVAEAGEYIIGIALEPAVSGGVLAVEIRPLGDVVPA